MKQGLHTRTRRAVVTGTLALAGLAGVSCAEVGTAPDVPAAIELPPFAFPSIVVGDTLRNEAGVVTPIQAIVRNSAGDILPDAPVRYLYAEFNRDGALSVDSVTGVVVALKALNGEGRLAARAGSSLQVLRPILTTERPDTAFAGARTPELITVFPDTGRTGARANTTRPLEVQLRNRQTTTLTPVNGWLVRFRLLRPANPANDTAAAAYLVNDNGGASVLDTTTNGTASRAVRVRADQFPVAQGTGFVTDTVVVEATVSYRGRPVAGSPLRLVAPVSRPSTAGGNR